MARTTAERSAEYRVRRALSLDAVLIDVCRETVITSGLMTAQQYDDPAERRSVLSAYLDEVLVARSFHTTNCHAVATSRTKPR